MDASYFYASIIAIVVLNINYIFMRNREKQDKEIILNLIVSCICEIVILVSIYEICSK